MNISKRLKTVASLVDKDAYILDCGCDHAYIPIYLIEKKIVAQADASDINEKPLLFAKKNIKQHNLSKKINLYQANGIEKINDKVDTIVLAGLGTETILEILNNIPENIDNLIISSNKEYYLLRKSITNKGFIIAKEITIYDKGKFYIIIKFIKGSKKYSKKELKYGINNQDIKVHQDYLTKIKSTDIEILKNIKYKHFFKKIRIKKEIREINTLL